MSVPRDVDAVREALRIAVDRIAAVERDWSHDVEITAVTKAFAPEIIETAVAAGCRAVGENYAQDLLAKAPILAGLDPGERPRVDFIGHLQSNKVRHLVGVVDRWCTVDRSSIADEIARRSPSASVLIQVNATGEDAKGGCAPGDVAGLVGHCIDLGLAVDGLLTIGPTGSPPSAAAVGFTEVRRLVDELDLAVCSMGMSDDLEVAVACGATNVRLGSTLFGPRPSSTVHQEGAARG